MSQPLEVVKELLPVSLFGFESELHSSLSGTVVMRYELCQSLPENHLHISFKMTQVQRRGALHLVNHEVIRFGSHKAALMAYARIAQGCADDWVELGAARVETRVREPLLPRVQVL